MFQYIKTQLNTYEYIYAYRTIRYPNINTNQCKFFLLSKIKKQKILKKLLKNRQKIKLLD